MGLTHDTGMAHMRLRHSLHIINAWQACGHMWDMSYRCGSHGAETWPPHTQSWVARGSCMTQLCFMCGSPKFMCGSSIEHGCFPCGSDVVQGCLTCGSAMVQLWLTHSSDVIEAWLTRDLFGSQMLQENFTHDLGMAHTWFRCSSAKAHT